MSHPSRDALQTATATQSVRAIDQHGYRRTKEPRPHSRLVPVALLLATLTACSEGTLPDSGDESRSGAQTSGVGSGSSTSPGSSASGGVSGWVSSGGTASGGQASSGSTAGGAGGNGAGGSKGGALGAGGSTPTPIPDFDGANYPAPPGAGTGTEYHVANSGDDGDTGASPDHAFKTLQHAVETVKPGDVVLVHSGQYAGFVVRASNFGSAQAWIVMRAADADPPVIRGTGSGPTVYFYAASCDEENGLTSGTCDRARWRLEGLSLLGSASGGSDGNVVKIDTPDVQLVRNKLCCSAADVIKNVRTADDTVIVGNEIWQDAAITAPSGNAQGVDITGADRLLVARNYLHDLSDVGVYAKGNARDTRFDANLLVNVGTSGDGNAIMCGQSTDAERLVDGDFETYGCIASNNVVIGSAGACVAVGSSQGARVAHNTCVNTARSTHAAIYLTNESEIGTESKDLEIVGNIIYQVTNHPVFQDTSSGAVSDWSSVRVDGNLFFAATGQPSFALRAGGLEEGASLDAWRKAFASVGGKGEKFLVADPAFSGDLSTLSGLALSPGSPAVDAVDCPSFIEVDQLGGGRPRGIRCDIGALER
jgi:hypothetical protein